MLTETPFMSKEVPRFSVNGDCPCSGLSPIAVLTSDLTSEKLEYIVPYPSIFFLISPSIPAMIACLEFVNVRIKLLGVDPSETVCSIGEFILLPKTPNEIISSGEGKYSHLRSLL